MVATIRHELIEAVVSYEEKPRDQWIFDPPAQVKYILYIHVYIYIYTASVAGTSGQSATLDCLPLV